MYTTVQWHQREQKYILLHWLAMNRMSDGRSVYNIRDSMPSLGCSPDSQNVRLL